MKILKKYWIIAVLALVNALQSCSVMVILLAILLQIG